MLSQTVKQTLDRARRNASSRCREEFTLEDLLLALTEDSDALDVFTGLGIDVEQLRRDLLVHLDAEAAGPGPRQSKAPQPTQALLRVINRAELHARWRGESEVNGQSMMLSLLHEQGARAVAFLYKQDTAQQDPDRVRTAGTSKWFEDTSGETEGDQDDCDRDGPDDGARTAREAYCVDLNKKARDGKVDPLIGRELEIERTIQVLCRRTKNNPLYV
ncbi:MAG: Clp protease N-terminal domain-containing protein, partial [Kiloniellales bacterium]|nr:Clp protease N-terminal domain-containing protein [Kiloniellales bacterium]